MTLQGRTILSLYKVNVTPSTEFGIGFSFPVQSYFRVLGGKHNNEVSEKKIPWLKGGKDTGIHLIFTRYTVAGCPMLWFGTQQLVVDRVGGIDVHARRHRIPFPEGEAGGQQMWILGSCERLQLQHGTHTENVCLAALDGKSHKSLVRLGNLRVHLTSQPLDER